MGIERRLYPRYPMDEALVVRLESSGGARIFDTRTVNISRTCIEIMGSRELVTGFLSQDNYPQVCEISFCMPGKDYEFAMKCQLVTHRRLSQHAFQLVLLFIDYYDDCKSLLEDHLAELAPPGITQG